MQFISNLRNRFSIINELLGFLWKERMWWLIPIVFVLVILGFLMIFATSSPIAPFIYPLF